MINNVIKFIIDYLNDLYQYILNLCKSFLGDLSSMAPEIFGALGGLLIIYFIYIIIDDDNSFMR